MPDTIAPVALRDIRIPTEEEDRAITAGALADPDNPPLTEAELARLASGAWTRRRGPQQAPTKVRVGVRLDADVVERLRASGPGWQGRLNATLRAALGL